MVQWKSAYCKNEDQCLDPCFHVKCQVWWHIPTIQWDGPMGKGTLTTWWPFCYLWRPRHPPCFHSSLPHIMPSRTLLPLYYRSNFLFYICYFIIGLPWSPMGLFISMLPSNVTKNYLTVCQAWQFDPWGSHLAGENLTFQIPCQVDWHPHPCLGIYMPTQIRRVKI